MAEPGLPGTGGVLRQPGVKVLRQAPGPACRRATSCSAHCGAFCGTDSVRLVTRERSRGFATALANSVQEFGDCLERGV